MAKRTHGDQLLDWVDEALELLRFCEDSETVQGASARKAIEKLQKARARYVATKKRVEGKIEGFDPTGDDIEAFMGGLKVDKSF